MSSRLRQSALDSLPDLSDITLAEIARGTGLSPSLLSRLFTDDPKQKRPNPELNTMLAIRDYLEGRTGRNITLDALAEAFRS